MPQNPALEALGLTSPPPPASPDNPALQALGVSSSARSTLATNPAAKAVGLVPDPVPSPGEQLGPFDKTKLGIQDPENQFAEDQPWWNRPVTTYLGVPEYRQGAGPIERGVEKFASGLVTPLNLGLMIATGGLGGIAEAGAAEIGELGASSLGRGLSFQAGKSLLSKLAPETAAQVAKSAGVIAKMANLGFTGQMIYGVAQAVPRIADAIKAGDSDTAIEESTAALLGGTMAGLSAYHLTQSIPGMRGKTPTWAQNKESLAAYQQKAREFGVKAYNFEQSNEKLIRNRPLDMAALVFHEAGENPETIARWRTEVAEDKAIRPAIREKWDGILQQAMNLPPEVQELSRSLRDPYDQHYNRLVEIGKLPAEAIHPETGEKIGVKRENYAGQHEYYQDDEFASTLKDVRARTSKTPGFVKHRTFDNVIDALHNGWEQTQGLAGAHAQYLRRFGEMEGVMAAENRMLELKAADGRPMAVNPAKARNIDGKTAIRLPKDFDVTNTRLGRLPDEPVVGPAVTGEEEPAMRRSPVAGQPLTPRGNQDIVEGVEDYLRERGVTPAVERQIVDTDARAKAIADAYEQMPHSPNDPTVKAAYDALLKDVRDQWDYATKKLGLTLEPVTEDPYPNSAAMMKDVAENHRLRFFKTTPGSMPADHPLAGVDPETGLMYNDMFRAIHDLFGHAAEGHEFGPRGEENAWNAHRRMFSPEAVPALTTETKGQNSWVNAGAHLRDEAGNVPAKGEPGYKTPQERPFAEQKAGLLPRAFWNRPEDNVSDAMMRRSKIIHHTVLYHPEKGAYVGDGDLLHNEVAEGLDLPTYGRAYDRMTRAWATVRPDEKRIEVSTGEGVGEKYNPREVTQKLQKMYPGYHIDHLPEGQEETMFRRSAGKTTDQLVSEYGTTPFLSSTGWLLSDGRKVPLVGQHHEMVSDKPEKFGEREKFINNTGSIRVRFRQWGRGGPEYVFSVPEKGVTPEQVAELQTAVDQAKNGRVLIETSGPDGSPAKIQVVDSPTPEKIAEAVEKVSGVRDHNPQEILGQIKSGKNFAILQAGNPGNERISDAENAARTKAMEADLRKAGYRPVPVEGHTKDVAGETEHAFYVPGIAPEEAARFARQYGQAGILTHEGLHWLDRDVVNPSDNAGVQVGKEARNNDYYTVLKTADGKEIPFSVPVDFEKEARPFAGQDTALARRGTPKLPDDLTEEEKAQILAGKKNREGLTRPEQFRKILSNLPPVKDFVEAAKAGTIGRYWYERSAHAFQAMRDLAPEYFHANDADRWAGVVAATSPQQGVPLNLREALDFWKQWHEAGRPMDEAGILAAQKKGKISPLTNQPAKLPNLVKALTGDEMLPADKTKYYKVGNFAGNLRGIGRNVTNDSWMGVFGQVPEKDVPTPQFYHAMALRTRAAAQELGWEPMQAQAAIWNFVKSLAELSGWKSTGGTYYSPVLKLAELTPEHMGRYAQDFNDIMYGDPEVRARLQQLGVDLNELDKRLQQAPAKPTVQRADEAVTNESLRRSARRIALAQQQLGGFTKYSKYTPPDQGLNFGGEETGDVSFNPEELARRSQPIPGKRVVHLMDSAKSELSNPAETGGLMVVDLNASARDLLSLAFQHGHAWEGINEGSDRVRRIADVLEKTDKAQTSKQYQELIQNLRTAADHNGDAGVPMRVTGLSPEVAQAALDEELWHAGQRAAGQGRWTVHSEDVLAHLAENPLEQKVSQNLQQNGYPDHPRTIALEAEAKILAGDYPGVGLTYEEAQQLMFDHVRALEAVHPDGIPTPNEHAQRYAAAMKKVAEKHAERIKQVQEAELPRPQAGRPMGEYAQPSGREAVGHGAEAADQGAASTAVPRRPTRDDESPVAGQTETPEFKNWFGDSKVVDKSGKPKIFYHGTAAKEDFSSFKSGDDLGSHFGTPEQANARVGMSPEMVSEATEVGAEPHQMNRRVVPVYLSIKNPVRLPDINDWGKIGDWRRKLPEIPADLRSGIEEIVGRVRRREETAPSIKAFLESKGYDGVVYKNKYEAGDGKDSYIAFHPEQIKSAIGNRGTFDPENSDFMMRRSAPGGEEERPSGGQPEGPKIISDKGALHLDVSDYKPAPSVFDRYRVKGVDRNNKPMYERASLLIHPDHVNDVNEQFADSSWFRKNPLTHTLLKISTEGKKSLLSFSPFHWTTEYLRGIQMGLSPLEAMRPQPLTPDRLAVRSKFGPTLVDTKSRSLFTEGAGEHSTLINKIPFFGNIMTAAENKLFGDYIPRLKADAFDKVVDQLAKRHNNWTDDQIHFAASKMVDAAFGGLNWKMLGVSANSQDALRLVMLAPDFTGSQVLFAKYGLGPGGSVIHQSLARIAAYNFLVARTLNLLVSGKLHLEHPFGVASPDDKRTFSIRTMPEDIFHGLTDPRGFIYNRLNPVLARTGWEALSGRDSRGKAVTAQQQIHDLIKNVMPIPGQNIIPAFRNPTDTIGTGIARGLGIASQPNTTVAQKKAAELASNHAESGPVDPTMMEHHQTVMQLEDAIRSKQVPMTALSEAVLAGQLSVKDAKNVKENLMKTQGMDEQMAKLYSRSARLPMNEFLDEVWSNATPQEKTALLPLLMKKRQAYFRKAMNELTPQQRLSDPTIRKLMKMVPGEPVF